MKDFNSIDVCLRVLCCLVLSMLLFSVAWAAQTCWTAEEYPNEWSDSRYTVDANGTVRDNITKLMWKQCSEGLSGNGCAIGTISEMEWKVALETAESSTFAGHNDWRLPNLKELSSLVAGNCYEPSINATIFPNTANSRYWTSSPVAKNSSIVNYAWSVYFDYGYDDNGDRYGTHRVRLVRAGQ